MTVYRDLKKLRKENQSNASTLQAIQGATFWSWRAERNENDVCRSSRSVRHSKNHWAIYSIWYFPKRTQVFATTLVGASSYHLKGMTFDVVFIRWSRSGLGRARLLGFRLSGSKKVVFAGWPFSKLPPTKLSPFKRLKRWTWPKTPLIFLKK